MEMENQMKKPTYSTSYQNTVKQTQNQMRKMKEENDLPPISFQEQPKSTQPEYFMFNFSKGQAVCRMKNFEEIQQSPQPVEKVVESSDETMLEQKQDQQKIERSYSENSMECEGENQQKKVEKMINHKQASLHMNQSGTINPINHPTLSTNKTGTNSLPNAIHQPIKTIQQNNALTQTKQTIHQPHNRQIKQKSKDQIHLPSQPAPIYNVVPNATPTKSTQQITQSAVQNTVNQTVQTLVQNTTQINQNVTKPMNQQVQVNTQMNQNSNQIQNQQTIQQVSTQQSSTVNKTKMTTPQATIKTQQQVYQQQTKVSKEKKPAKLRIQPASEKKQRPLIPIKPSKITDPNITKRREMIKVLRDIQRKNFFSPIKPNQQPNEIKSKTFIKDMNEYCNRNDFFRCQSTEKGEMIVSCDILGEKRMDVVFDLNENNYENWNFPKPKMSDGKEICDKNMMEKMKKQPSIEIFMNELFRIAAVCCEQY